MNKLVITVLTVCGLFFGSSISAQAQKASVILSAGQSNADGRVYNDQLPDFLKGGYQHLHFANVTKKSTGKFYDLARDFTNTKKRWAYDYVTYYYIDQATKNDFYAVKCSYGGTSIDPAATVDKLPKWYADAQWIGENNAYRGDIATGKSLTKSLVEGFDDCVDVTLSKLKGGYDVKCIIWHQGESDRRKAANYYTNFKTMIEYMRQAVYKKTGDKNDLTLPFIFGTVSHRSKQYSKAVEEAQLKVAKELPNVYYIDMSEAGLKADNLHFDGPWTIYFGQMMYNKLVDLKLVDGKKIKVEKPAIVDYSAEQKK